MNRHLVVTVSIFLLASISQAFPPAPYYTLYGIVRDQVGQTITADGGVLVLFKDDKEIGRTPIIGDLWIDQNYELKISIDANRPDTQLYSGATIPADGQFSLRVEMNGTQFYPIEASGTLSAGKGAERKRLDLTLGIDSDNDGLPDVWEQWQLYQAGESTDENGNWPIELIDRNGDYDGDGQSNFMEYIAGTFAGDATESLLLEVKEKLPNHVRFEFYAITGKSYTIEKSTDAITWVRVPFSLGSPSAGSTNYRAESVGVRSAFTESTSDAGNEFYRLSVR